MGISRYRYLHCDVFTDRVRQDLQRVAGSAEVAHLHAALGQALERFDRCTRRMLELNDHAPRDAAAGASAYLRLAGLVACGLKSLSSFTSRKASSGSIPSAEATSTILPARSALIWYLVE